MLSNDFSIDEPSRLATLAEFRILDTAPEAEFDDLTRLAAYLCGAPIALISLVGEHRQWFKSRVGLDVCETSREVSFCAHALRLPDLMIVPDAALDARFAENPLVRGKPHIRFYAGAPLRTPEGHAIGTLCVIDREPRTLSPEQQEALKTLGRSVMTQLNLRLAARELWARTQLLQAVAEETSDAMFVKDLAGRYLLCNEAAAAFVGKPVAEVLGRDDSEIFDPKSAKVIMARDRRVIASGEAETKEDTFSANGLRRTFLATKTPYRDREGKTIGVIGISRDITETNAAEAALKTAYDELQRTQQIMVQQERLRAFGQLASGVAHDINNAICPVSIYTKVLLKSDASLSAQTREYLEIIQNAAKAVGETVSRLRKFYKDEADPACFKPLNVGTLLAEVAALTRARWSDMAKEHGAVIGLHIESPENLLPIRAVEGEFREALINLIFNAVDALPDGGRITLRAGVLPCDPHRVWVEVADNGIGMDEEARHRCFEPFYTTKGERGTGLGLAMVAGIAQRHDAEISVDSNPGTGTTFRITFPSSTAPSQAELASTRIEEMTSMKILVIDDDPLILQALRVAVESEGHRPHCAIGGQAGIGAFRDALDAGDPFDAVFTDLGMPHVDGRKVAATVKTAAPTTPVILLTGWGQKLKADAEIPPGVDHVLAKPVSPEDLTGALAICRADASSAH